MPCLSSCGYREGLGDKWQQFVCVLLPVGNVFGDGTPHLSVTRFSHDALLQNTLLLCLCILYRCHVFRNGGGLTQLEKQTRHIYNVPLFRVVVQTCKS